MNDKNELTNILGTNSRGALMFIDYRVLEKACASNEHFVDLTEQIEGGSGRHLLIAYQLVRKELWKKHAKDYKSYFEVKEKKV